ncbi:hypothetical protein FRB97_006366 [Tulasnella sp. 331]|nr:hypothetical protein FRB97_006366 [Tulasnella sp. 331]
MRVSISLALLLPALAVVQASSSTSSGVTPAESGAITPCITDCSSQAAAVAGCSSYADLACICPSTVFTQNADACLAANCTTAEQTAAQGLDTSLCAPFVGNSTTNTMASATAAVASATSSAGAVLSSITSSAGAALSSLSSAASTATATATKSAAGLNAQLPGLKILSVAGTLLATVVGPVVLFA